MLAHSDASTLTRDACPALQLHEDFATCWVRHSNADSGPTLLWKVRRCMSRSCAAGSNLSPSCSLTLPTSVQHNPHDRSATLRTGSKSGAKTTPPAYSAVPTKEEDADEPGASARRAV